ncbi:MAG: sugar ABC transporter permease [Oscillospiraceae bacterium]|jgi:raffinose/stachyose/melibiose transport system permease protein|nr:sugar ABC transporter permease [Oscillospiraceae bacterium]
MLQTIRPKGRVIFAYLLIPLAVYAFAVFVPLFTALYYSFFNWKGGPVKTFNGITNYVSLLHDRVFWESFGHNIYLIAACIIGQIGIAFLFVLMINSKTVKLKGIHRTFGFFPSTIAAVSIGFIWTMVYDYKRGIVNWFISSVLHISTNGAQFVWLNRPELVMLLISIPLMWQYIGYYMVIIISAVSSIDPSLFEAAEIDGASEWQRARHITLPMIKNTLLVCMTLCIAGNMKAFDHIYVMTSGGPGNSSMVMSLYGYKVSFTQMNMGYGSAISVGIFVLSLLIIVISQTALTRLTRESEV